MQSFPAYLLKYKCIATFAILTQICFIKKRMNHPVIEKQGIPVRFLQVVMSKKV